MKYWFLFVLLFFTFPLFAQLTLQGTIRAADKNPNPLSNATIRLENNEFKQELKSNDAGNFTINNLKPGSYQFRVSFIGYQTKDTILLLATSQNIAISLFQQSKALDSITVTAKQDFVVKKIDRISYQIDGRSIYQNKTVSDILKTIPRLSVTRSGVEIKGMGPAAILIDDKMVYLSSRDLLEFLNAFKNDIASVEVIQNPPAKYDAQGGGLINIVTKKRKAAGTFGYLESSVVKNSYLQNSETISLSTRNRNFSLIGSAGTDAGAYKETTQNISEFNTSSYTWFDDAANKNSLRNYRFNLAAEWLLSKKSKFNVSYNLITTRNAAGQNHSLKYLSQNNIDSTGVTDGYFKSNGQTHIANIGFSSSFGKNNNTIESSIDYINKNAFQDTRTDTHSFLTPLFSPTNSNYTIYSSGKLPRNVISGKFDLTFPNLTYHITLETGGKYSAFDNRSVSAFDRLLNGKSLITGYLTNDDFNYQEKNIAGYVSATRDFNKWTAKIGLRFEDAMSRGISKSANFNRNFANFFPSVFLLRKLNESNSIDFSYTRRVVRPSLFDLNPFRFYTSSLSYYEGNPSLIPSLQDNLNLNLNLNNTYLFTLYFNNTNLPIVSFPSSDGNTVGLAKRNDGALKSYGINADASFNFLPAMQSSFSLTAGSYVYKSSFEYQLGKTPINISVSTTNSYQISSTLSADLNFSATLPGATTIASQKGYSSLDIGFSKTLLNNKLILTLAGQDLLRSGTQSSTIRTHDYTTINSNYYDFRQVALTVRYKFGTSVKVVRKKANIQEFNRMR
jgi:hypothetical protein